ncbi:hypothetical protein BpHYR1_036094 [Brachionus plicatilis]|uniref:Uncharacterized protein n=1 Tax=Brachionus plicatilis TaxID=10195 RepID=A0A3M7Q5Q5_BRAPC|nr:hypothetical protein BpHYR1_036094 [Brachionus plicatilis]
MLYARSDTYPDPKLSSVVKKIRIPHFFKTFNYFKFCFALKISHLKRISLFEENQEQELSENVFSICPGSLSLLVSCNLAARLHETRALHLQLLSVFLKLQLIDFNF